MSTIGGRIMISTIEDGATLHTLLMCDAALSQAVKGTSYSPDWSGDNSHPKIYLDVKNGTSHVNVNAGGTWYYKNRAIVFDSSNNNISSDGKFQLSTRTVGGYTYPALLIIGNLADQENSDEQVIAYEGAVTMSESSVAFRATITVTLTFFREQGGYASYIGTTSDHGFNFTADGQSITLYNVLQEAGENSVNTVASTSYTADWYVNGVLVTAQSKLGTVNVGTVSCPSLTLTEGEIVDYAVVECRCITGTGESATLVSTSYREVNDLSDPEMMYISSVVSTAGGGYQSPSTTETGEGNENTLKKGQQVNYDVWVATETDAQAVDTQFKYFYIELRNSLNEAYNTSSLSGTDLQGSAVNGTYRALNGSGGNTGHGKFMLTYDHVKAMGGKASGILIASTQALT